MDRWSHVATNRDEPRLDPILLHEMTSYRAPTTERSTRLGSAPFVRVLVAAKQILASALGRRAIPEVVELAEIASGRRGGACGFSAERYA